MDRITENRELIPTGVVWMCGVAALLLVLAGALLIAGGTWTLWIESDSVSVSMEITVFGDSFFELRLNSGSHHTKEEMDSQKDWVGVWRSGSALHHGLWIAERRR